MKVIFKYDIEKDIDNFQKGLQTVNNPNPTVLHKEFFETHDEEKSLDREFVREFIQNKTEKENLDFKKQIFIAEENWKIIEKEYFSRCEELFDLTIPSPIIAYLSLNSRCTYRWKENYFFLSYFHIDSANHIIMHELLHFYTHRKYDGIIKDKLEFNKFKESLTVILNTEFKDLLEYLSDKGYPKHQEYREEIIKKREEGRSIDDIFEEYRKLSN